MKGMETEITVQVETEVKDTGVQKGAWGTILPNEAMDNIVGL